MKRIKRQDIFEFVFFLFLIMTMIYGNEMQSFSGMDLSICHQFLVLFCSCLCAVAFVLIHSFVKRKYGEFKPHVGWIGPLGFKNSRYLIFLLLLCGWFPAFLSFFPGNWTYDTNWAVNMICYENISAHQPLLFTFMIDLVLRFGSLVGSDQVAVVLFTVLQMLLLSYSFSSAIHYVFRRYKVSPFVQWIIVLFFALMPFNQVFAVTIAKDVTFAGLAPLVFVGFAELMKKRKNQGSVWQRIRFITICTIWIALRNNAFYALLVFGILCVFVYGVKSGVTRTALISCLCYFVINKSVIMVGGYGVSSPMEMLSVPMSQLARVSVVHGDSLNESEQRMMNTLFPTEYDRNYDPYIADFVKINIPGYNLHDRLNLIGFVSFYKNMGLKYPGDYFNAFAMLNLGSYYPLDETYSRVYIDTYRDGIKQTKPENEINIGYISTYFENHENYDYHEASILKQGKSFYDRLCTQNSFMGNPLLMILLSPATYFWMIFASFLAGWCRKDKNVIMLSILPLLYWCTQLLGPCALSRYLYVLMVLAPFCLVVTFCEKREIEQGS